MTLITRNIARSVLAISIMTLAACAPAQHEGYTEEEMADEAAPLSEERKLELQQFTNPDEVSAESEDISLQASYGHLDPKHLIRDALLEKAVRYYDANKTRIKNKNYLTIVDFSKHSMYNRMFIVNMKTGAVSAVHTSHGSGSDKNHDGYAEKFSNVSGSNMSSLGFYLTAETYTGKNGYSLRLDGLSSTNSNARSRAVVVHGANYVYDSNTKAGRSQGCPAVSHANRDRVINMIKGGSLIYGGV